MDDLRDTLMAYGCIAIRAGDFNGLNDFLEQECGTRLHVAWPERCFIQLRSRSALGPFVGKMGTVCSQGKPHVVEDTWKEDVRSGTFFPGVFNVRGFFLLFLYQVLTSAVRSTCTPSASSRVRALCATNSSCSSGSAAAFTATMTCATASTSWHPP